MMFLFFKVSELSTDTTLKSYSSTRPGIIIPQIKWEIKELDR